VPGELAEGGIEAETRQTLLNIDSALRAAGSSLQDVVKVTAFLRDVDLDFDGYNRTYMEFFRDRPPARITAQAKVYGRSRIEIDCIAYSVVSPR
jgi:2-iminobutanoate/2-iminopropanoate deaminase